ncbi:hypothetical protein MKW94_015919 [Papaver nudicaule]|uniref:Uncharacterized protein n=1 Tax=Papaver nudicaule TaxID=74823 RepID=A0AA41RTC3_PAPNU|nr:hypothetical protein [Papaver nudicaule]
MPSPLRKSGGGSSSLSAGSSKNSSSSSSDKGSSSYLDSNTNEDMVKKKKKGNAKLNAVKYRAILLKNQGLTGDKKKSKSGKKINAEICGGGGFSEECCKDVQPESAVLEMAEERSDEDDNVCAICKLGGSGGTLLWVTVPLILFS